MKGVLVKAVNTSVFPLLKSIQTPTLLIFGENDEDTPVYMGEILQKNLPDAGLIILENDDHFAYYHQQNRFLIILDEFLKD